MKDLNKSLDIGTRLIAAGILGYSVFINFTSHPIAVYIFQRIGMEPYGRYAVGALELLAIVLLMLPKQSWRGATLGALLMFGAIFMHLVTGNVVIRPNGVGPGDGGLMFGAAMVELFCCISVLAMRETEPETELS